MALFLTAPRNWREARLLQFGAGVAVDLSAQCDFDDLWGFPPHKLFLQAEFCMILRTLPDACKLSSSRPGDRSGQSPGSNDCPSLITVPATCIPGVSISFDITVEILHGNHRLLVTRIGGVIIGFATNG
jgi:hypothetical protein